MAVGRDSIMVGKSYRTPGDEVRTVQSIDEPALVHDRHRDRMLPWSLRFSVATSGPRASWHLASPITTGCSWTAG